MTSRYRRDFQRSMHQLIGRKNIPKQLWYTRLAHIRRRWSGATIGMPGEDIRCFRSAICLTETDVRQSHLNASIPRESERRSMGGSQVSAHVQATNLLLMAMPVCHNQNGLRNSNFEPQGLKEGAVIYIYGTPKTDLPLLLRPASIPSDFLMDSYWLLIHMAARCAKRLIFWLRGIADLNREEVSEDS